MAQFSSGGANKRAEGMIFLKQQNMIVEEAIGTRMFDDPPKREPCDLMVADFDDTKFKVLVTPEKPSYVALHISLGMAGQKIKTEMYGPEIMEATYPGMVIEAEKGYDFAIGFDIDAVAAEDREALLFKVSSMRRHLLGAPIIKALQGVKTGTGGSLPFMGLETRPTEALFVKPGNDRCTIVFALNFPDETDNAIARVMLQQFAKESSKVNGSPPCQYAEARNPPLEIRDLPMVASYDKGCGFVSFVIFAEHIKTDAKFEKAVTMLANFRNYLHYHVKASKTYLHMRMRGKVKGWLQVLNKSHHEKDAKDAKTASGKTFKRMST